MTVAVAGSSFYNPTGTQNASTGSGPSIPLPTRTYAVGDYLIAAVYFAQANGGAATIVTPTGWTVLTPSPIGTSSNRVMVLYEYKVTDATALANLGTSFFAKVGYASTRIAAEVDALTGVDLTATTVVGAIEFSASSASSYTFTAPGSGAVKITFLGTNTSSPSTGSTFTATGGTKINQSRSTDLASGSTADSQLASFLGSTGATSGAATANHVSFGIGLTAAASASTIDFAGSSSLSLGGVPSVSGAAALSGSQSLTLVGSASGAATATLSGSQTLTVAATSMSASGAVALSGSQALTAIGKPSVAGSIALSGSQVLTAGVARPIDFWVQGSPLDVFHRNAELDWAEQTAFGYTQAARWNKTAALEISVQRSQDGHWVASHDPTTGRVYGGTSLNILTTDWAAGLSAKTTIVGGYPIAELADLLDMFPDRIFWVEYKGTLNYSDFFDVLDAHGGNSRILVKGYSGATGYATLAHNRGYLTWGYFYAADISSLPTRAPYWDLLGGDVTGSTADWTALKSYGKKVVAHTINNATDRATALALGADGYMDAKAIGVVSQTPATATLGGSQALTMVGAGGGSSTIALSGSSSLAMTAKPGANATIALVGSQALAATGKPGAAGVVALSGSQALSVVVSAGVGGSVALSGSQALTAVGSQGSASPIALGGSQVLTATGKAAILVAVMLVGSQSLTASGQGSGSAAINFSGSQILSLLAAIAVSGSVALSGSQILTALATSDQVFFGDVEIEIAAARWEIHIASPGRSFLTR